MRKSRAETKEEGFTFQCLGCWKVDCLKAELARLPDIVNGVEVWITKETDGIESYDRQRGRKKQCSDKKGEERRLRGEMAIVTKTNGERTTENMTSRKVTREKVTVEKERVQWDRRGEKYMWQEDRWSEERYVNREINNRDDDRKKRGRKERNNKASSRGNS